MPRKTDSNNPSDWLMFATSDFDAIRELSARQICYEVCRSRLAECLEKALKAGLISFGWKLARTHDLVRLADELRLYDEILADLAQEECEALAEVYFAERYPGFDLDDADWVDFLGHATQVRVFLEAVSARVAKCQGG